MIPSQQHQDVVIPPGRVERMNKKTTFKRNTVRIIGGYLRSRRINFPDLPRLRPTSDRIRETLFNWVQDGISEERCLDLFAGSGALGIEAISRGAERVVFVEKDQKAIKSIAENLNHFEIANADLYCMDARHWAQHYKKNEEAQYGIVFLDPPFVDNIIYQACSQLVESDCLKSKCKIYIEAADKLIKDKLPSDWALKRNKQAGLVQYYLFEKQ